MRKTNTFEIVVDIRKNKFDIEAKHDVVPTKLIEVVSTLLSEYRFLLINESEEPEKADDILDNIEKVIDLIEDKGKISLKICEYQINTFGMGSQKVYEIDHNKNLNLFETACVLTIISTFMVDTLIESFGVDNKLYELDENEAIKVLGGFRGALETLTGCSNIKGVTNVILRNEIEASEDRIDMLMTDIGFISTMSSEVIKEIKDDIDESKFNDLEKERYKRLVEYSKYLDDQTNNNCGCGHEHHSHNDCGCDHDNNCDCGHKN